MTTMEFVLEGRPMSRHQTIEHLKVMLKEVDNALAEQDLVTARKLLTLIREMIEQLEENS